MRINIVKISFIVGLWLLTTPAALASDKFLLNCKSGDPENKLMSELISIDLNKKNIGGVASFILATKEVGHYLLIEGNFIKINIFQGEQNPWVTEELVINRITGQFSYRKVTKNHLHPERSETKEFGGQCEKRGFEAKF